MAKKSAQTTKDTRYLKKISVIADIVIIEEGKPSRVERVEVLQRIPKHLSEKISLTPLVKRLKLMMHDFIKFANAIIDENVKNYKKGGQ